MFMNLIHKITASSFLSKLLLVLKYIIEMKFHRIDIKSHEIAKIFDISESTAREWIREVKAAFNKNRKQKITIAEFCDFKGVPYKTIFCQINKIKPKEYDNLLNEGFIEEPKVFVMQRTVG